MADAVSPGLPKDVIETISHSLSDDWHKFGIYIGFSHTQLENLRASFHTNGLCWAVSRMLDKWGRVATELWNLDKCLKFLGNSLEEIERRDILENLNISRDEDYNSGRAKIVSALGIILAQDHFVERGFWREQTHEDREALKLDVEILTRITSLCLCLKWPSNIDIRLLSRIEKWKNDSGLFYETRAYKHIKRVVDEKGIVIIIGKQGDGKTFIAEHLLLHYLYLGYELVLVNSADEWRQRWNPTIRQVIFIDDVFGKTQCFPSQALQQWVILGQEMTECNEGGNTKVISTVRDYIHKDCQGSVRGVEIFRNIVNISSHDWKLTPDEKYGMLEVHIKHFEVKLNKNQLKDIAENDYIQGFPLRCRLFFSDPRLKLQVSSFFLGHLADVLVDELHYLAQTDKPKYAALVMLLLCDGVIQDETTKSDKDLNLRTRIFKFFRARTVEPMERLFSLLKSDLGISETQGISHLLDSLHALTGTYVIKVGSSFRFVHESVAEAIAFTFGNSRTHQDLYLTHCSLSELQQRVQLCPSETTYQYITSPVQVHVMSYPALAMRLTMEVMSGHTSDLLSDSRFFKKGFPEYWKTYLTGLDMKRLRNILEMKDKRGNTFSSLIARQGCVPLLSLLLSTSPVLTASQLMLQAASTGKTEAVEMLLKEGANINQKTHLGQTALLLSSVEGHISLANFLLAMGADINITDVQGCCPLHSACAHGQLPIVQQLLHKGVNINVTDTIGSTAIFYASLKGYTDIVQTLMDYHADITITNSFGGNPLLASCVNGHINVLHLVLDKHPNLNRGDFKGKTALHWACQRGFVEIVKLLLGKGVRVNLKDERCQTPLHLAAMKGHTHIWRMLVSAGADMYVTDKDGQTPVSLANKESKIPMLFD